MGMRHDMGRGGTRVRILAGERVNWIENNKRRNYIRAIVISCPPWFSIDDLRDVRMLAAWCDVMRIMTGKEWTLDHIVPVNGKNVSGLSVPWNLQPYPRLSNMSKSNKFNPEQGELFTKGCDTTPSGND